jgi:hypothetical protein
MSGRQDIEALATGGGFDKQPLHTPEHSKKRGKHKMRGIHEKDGSTARLGFG